MPRFRHVLRSKCLASAPLLLALGCADQDEIEKPMAPDMSEVVAAYQAPTAPLTADEIDDIAAEAQERVDLLREIGVNGAILDALRAAGDAQQEGEPGGSTQATTEPVRSIQQRELVFGEGFLRAVRICNGWGPEPVPNIDENGFILLLAGFDSIGFDSVVWGGFLDCKYAFEGINIELRGTNPEEYGLYRAFIGEDVPFDQTGTETTYFRFDLVAVVSGQVNPLAFDVKLDAVIDLIQTRITVDDGGYVIPAVGRDLVGIAATNGNFICTGSTRTCTNGTETLSY